MGNRQFFKMGITKHNPKKAKDYSGSKNNAWFARTETCLLGEHIYKSRIKGRLITLFWQLEDLYCYIDDCDVYEIFTNTRIGTYSAASGRIYTIWGETGSFEVEGYSRDFSFMPATKFAYEVKSLSKYSDKISTKVTQFIEEQILVFKNAEHEALTERHRNKVIEEKNRDDINWLNDLIDKS